MSRKYFCDICKKEYDPQIHSKTFVERGFYFTVAFYHRQPNGLPGQPAEICHDCLVLALTENDTMKNLRPPNEEKTV